MEQFLLGELALSCLDRFEAEILAQDVQHYFDEALRLSAGATILDVGANIGVFSEEIYRRLGGEVRVLAFEPIAPIAEILARNATVMGGRIEVHRYGLGARDEELEFTFFPGMSCLSSSQRGPENLAAERARIAATCVELIRDGRFMPHLRALPEELLGSLTDSWLATRLRGESHRVRVRPLSAVIDEQGLGAIDLLKIDVEGAELDVLAGIEARHFPQVRQIVLELERFDSRRMEVEALLTSRGYRVHAKQDSVMRKGDYGLIFGLSSAA